MGHSLVNMGHFLSQLWILLVLHHLEEYPFLWFEVEEEQVVPEHCFRVEFLPVGQGVLMVQFSDQV